MTGSAEQGKATCWTMIRGAATGDAADRDRFARCYDPAVRAYLRARWKSSAHLETVDDAVQDVFLDCFKEGGALARAEENRAGGFRAFLYGVVRNVARRVEDHARRNREHPPPADFREEDHAAYEAHLSQVFDRAWAEALVREAVARQRERARERGPAEARRVELLQLRFHEGLAIREIAARWGTSTIPGR
ncbi:MAG: sigma-70 family RNA polymerase sigma factor [Planctomycetes bacterium]|nr:sigma-70 family RNA polymerase sigma factor [Planctomycetota bacterium]